jgi:outer membrane protein OmpA-like peptidoglycan-associated protein
MFRRMILSLLLLPAGVSPLTAGEVFRFHYRPGQHYHIENEVQEDIYRNDVLAGSVRLRNIGDVTVRSVEGERALHEGVYLYYSDKGTGTDFVLEERYPTRFHRDVYGAYEIDRRYFMPVVRGVPTFPDEPVDVGDQWMSRAHEVQDLRPVFGIPEPVVFPARASYQYLGNHTVGGERLAKISINYVVNYTLQYQSSPAAVVPVRAIGYFNQLYNWNIDRGVPYSYSENFDFIFILSSGETLEYVGNTRASVTVTEPLPEDEVVEEVRDRLQRSIPSAEVRKTQRGILINIGEILFQFDSDELTASADRDLENIVDVLEDFPGRDIRVIGHTDAVGTEEYNRSLSLRRAKRTAGELVTRLPGAEGRISYVGLGESRPIANNATEEGRARNRRVEIIILNE